jgi:hypothetical protein
MTDNWPLETVLEYMDSDLRMLRWGAVFMAGKWADHEEVLKKLREIERNDPDTGIRRLARSLLPNGRSDPKRLRETLQSLQDLREIRQQIDRARQPERTVRYTWNPNTGVA